MQLSEVVAIRAFFLEVQSAWKKYGDSGLQKRSPE
jgi:hypothetical protein